MFLIALFGWCCRIDYLSGKHWTVDKYSPIHLDFDHSWRFLDYLFLLAFELPQGLFVQLSERKIISLDRRHKPGYDFHFRNLIMKFAHDDNFSHFESNGCRKSHSPLNNYKRKKMKNINIIKTMRVRLIAISAKRRLNLDNYMILIEENLIELFLPW